MSDVGQGTAAGQLLSWNGAARVWVDGSVAVPLVSNTNNGVAPAITGARRVFAADVAGTSAIWSTALLADQSTTGSPNAAAVVQPINTAGSPTALRVTGGAHTTLAAGAEAQDIAFALARTVQFATGAIAAQRAMRITAPTYAFVAASTISDAATFAISGAPAAGANATFTRAAALWVESGALQMGASAARTGDIRVPHNWTIRGRDNTDANDRIILSWGVTTNSVTLGSSVNTTRVQGADLLFLVSTTERARIGSAAVDFNNGTNSNYAIQGNGENLIGLNIAAAGVRNIAFFNDGSTAMNSMDGGIFLLNAIAAPVGNNAAGGYLYGVAGGGTWRGSGGTVTTFGPA